MNRHLLIFLSLLFCAIAATANADTSFLAPSEEPSASAALDDLNLQLNLAPLITTTTDETTDFQGCCKICTTGKACGNSCISRSYTCHKPKGCACDG